MANKTKYTKELLTQAVRSAESIAEILRFLGLRPAGGSYTHIQQLIKRYEIDTSHLVGQGAASWGRHGRLPPSYKAPHEILVLGRDLTRLHSGSILKAKLIETGREMKCSVCEMLPVWQGKPIRLEIDHINGKAWDNRPDNLRFICPNCHTQTATDGAGGAALKTRRRQLPRVPRPKPSPRLCACGTHIQRKSKTCVKCSPHLTKAQWPANEDLARMVWETPPNVIAKCLGVSGNAIIHRCKKRSIPCPPRGYWAKKRSGKL
jgi:hypothetical protein